MTADDRRATLLNALAEFVLAEGLDAASLRPLARAAGTSDRMLLYYFADKDAVLREVLGCLVLRFARQLDKDLTAPQPYGPLRQRLRSTVLGETLWPYLSLRLQILGRAARGDETCLATAGDMGRAFHSWIADQLDAEGGDHTAEAAQLSAEIEGLIVLRAAALGEIISQSE